MDSAADEWQVVKPKKQRKQKENRPASQASATAKSVSAGANNDADPKSKNGKGKTPAAPAPAQAGKSGGQNAKQAEKKSEPKRPAVMKMPLNTAEQMAHFIQELVVNTPPPSNKLSIAAIGEKVLSITKNAWSKKYKTSFGSLRSFLESQPGMFTVIGEDVFLAGSVRVPSPTAPFAKQPSQADPKAKQAVANKRQAVKHQEAAAKPSSRTAKKSTKAARQSSRDGQGVGYLKALAVVGLLGAVILFTLASVNVVDLKSLQRFVQQKFLSKR